MNRVGSSNFVTVIQNTCLTPAWSLWGTMAGVMGTVDTYVKPGISEHGSMTWVWQGVWEPSPACPPAQVRPDAADPSRRQAEATMEQCASVEREVDKVLQKFLTYGQHCEQSLEELLHYVGQLRAELASAGGCVPVVPRPPPCPRGPHLPPRGPGSPQGCLVSGF